MKRIASAFLALLMVLSMTSVAFASDSTDLDLSARPQDGQNIVSVYLAGNDVTNGCIEVTYDPSEVTLISVTPGDDSWIVSVNTTIDGKVIFAWVGSHINARTKLVTLVFGPRGSNPYTSYTAVLTELYSSGVKQELPSIIYDTITSPGGSGGGSSSGGSSGGSGSVPAHPFTDIAGHWAEADIAAAYQFGLFNGTGDGTTFSPDMTLTRGMLVTLLYRLAGEPTVSGSHPFTDVADGLYYSNAVIWAYTNNIVNGTGNGSTFSPDLAVSREQMITMLFRYAQHMGISTLLTTGLSHFSDADNLSDWAEQAMKWAVAEGIISGTPAGELAPTVNIDRAQAATILVRFLG